jgi:hypothetical protein
MLSIDFWRWFGYKKSKQVYLGTVSGGRLIVMDFIRWGMQNAQPRFRSSSCIMQPSEKLLLDDNDVICGIDHPDARLIEMAPILYVFAKIQCDMPLDKKESQIVEKYYNDNTTNLRVDRITKMGKAIINYILGKNPQPY